MCYYLHGQTRILPTFLNSYVLHFRVFYIPLSKESILQVRRAVGVILQIKQIFIIRDVSHLILVWKTFLTSAAHLKTI